MYFQSFELALFFVGWQCSKNREAAKSKSGRVRRWWLYSLAECRLQLFAYWGTGRFSVW